jgi:hypothetical protein
VNPGQIASINGNLPFESVLADGATTTLPMSQNADVTVFETTAEVKVSSTGFSAQYGVGDIVYNQVTKGGTDAFHGAGYDYFQNNVGLASSGVAANEDSLEQANMGIAIGDYLHSGRMSLLISHFDNENAALYRNEGDMNFTDPSLASGIARGTRRYVGWGDAFVDFDNDGWLDYFVVNGHVYSQVDSAHQDAKYREPKPLFENQRDGTFKNLSKQAGQAIQAPQVSRGMPEFDRGNATDSDGRS